MNAFERQANAEPDSQEWERAEQERERSDASLQRRGDEYEPPTRLETIQLQPRMEIIRPPAIPAGESIAASLKRLAGRPRRKRDPIAGPGKRPVPAAAAIAAIQRNEEVVRSAIAAPPSLAAAVAALVATHGCGNVIDAVWAADKAHWAARR